MTPSIPVGEVRLLGDRAFLIGVADAAAARALAGELTAALGGEAEVVCGAATVMVHATDADTELGPLAGLADRCVARRARHARPGSTGRPAPPSPSPVGSTGPIWRRWPRGRPSGPTRWRRCSRRNP